jgi:hypothetical protein
MVRRYRLLLEVGETIVLGRDGQLSCVALQPGHLVYRV